VQKQSQLFLLGHPPTTSFGVGIQAGNNASIFVRKEKK